MSHSIRSMASNSARKQKSKGRGISRANDSAFKVLNLTLSNKYSIFENMPHKLRSYFSKVRATYSLDFDLLHRGLSLYLLSNSKVTQQLRKDLAIELRLVGKPTRADILLRPSEVMIERSFALAKFYTQNVSDYRDHLSLGIHLKRKYPCLFLKFLGVMRQVERTAKIPNSSSYIFIEKSKIKSDFKITSKEGLRSIFTISNKFEFFQELETLTELFNVYDPTLNLDFNLLEELPTLGSFLSCLVKKTESGYELIHSDKLPTAFEAAESILFCVDYDLTGIPSKLIGSHVYEVPKDLEDYVILEFWKEFYASKGVTAISSMEAASVPYDISKVNTKLNIVEKLSKTNYLSELDSSSGSFDESSSRGTKQSPS